MRSPSLIASSMSWVTNTTVLRELALEPQELVLQARRGRSGRRRRTARPSAARRVGGQRPGDADALALAAGELARVAVAHLGLEPDEVEQLVDPRPLRAPCPSRAAWGRSRCSRATVWCGNSPTCWIDVADLAAQLGRVAPVTLSPSSRIVAARRARSCRLTIRIVGRLAAARRADQHADLAGGDREASDPGSRAQPGRGTACATCTNSTVAAGAGASGMPDGPSAWAVCSMDTRERVPGANRLGDHPTGWVGPAHTPAARRAAGVRRVLERVVERRERRRSPSAAGDRANPRTRRSSAAAGRAGRCR